MRVESKITSVSWIPIGVCERPRVKPVHPANVSHYDPPPPNQLERLDALRTTDRFRFANVVEAWVEFAGDVPVAHGARGGLLMGSSTGHFGPISLTVKGIEMPTIRPEADVGDSWVRVRQTAGGRTAFPLPRRRSTPPFVRVQSPIVWTTLELTLHADGSARGMMSGASAFPRHWVYDAEDTLTVKSGTADSANWLAQRVMAPDSVGRSGRGRHRDPRGTGARTRALGRHHARHAIGR